MPHPDKIQFYLGEYGEKLAESASSRGLTLSAEIRRRIALTFEMEQTYSSPTIHASQSAQKDQDHDQD